MTGGLKNATVKIDGLGELTVQEISARVQCDYVDAVANNAPRWEQLGLLLRGAVPDWHDRDIGELMDELTLAQVEQIAGEAAALSGFDFSTDETAVKNFEAGRAVALS